MQKLSEFIEAVLLAVATYPFTLIQLLASPRKVVGISPGSLTCPPALAIAISVFLYWWARSALREIATQGQLQTRLPNMSVLAGAVVAIGIILLVWRIVVQVFFGLRTVQDDPLEDLKLLSYPASVGLGSAALLIVLAINFPEATIWLHGTLDSEAAGVTAGFSQRVVFLGAVDFVMAIPVSVLSAWSLFNILRIPFGASTGRALGATFATFAAFLGAGIVVIFFAFALENTTRMMEQLSIGLEHLEESLSLAA